MKSKVLTIRKANRKTIKDENGSYIMHEADVSLTVDMETEPETKESDVIERVKQLVEQTMSDDPNWIDEEQPNERRGV